MVVQTFKLVRGFYFLFKIIFPLYIYKLITKESLKTLPKRGKVSEAI